MDMCKMWMVVLIDFKSFSCYPDGRNEKGFDEWLFEAKNT